MKSASRGAGFDCQHFIRYSPVTVNIDCDNFGGFVDFRNKNHIMERGGCE